MLHINSPGFVDCFAKKHDSRTLAATLAAKKDDLRITFTPLERCAKDGVIDRIDFIFARGFRVDRASHAGDKDWPSDHRMVIAEVSKLKASAKPKSPAEPAKKEAKARTVKRPASAGGQRKARKL